VSSSGVRIFVTSWRSSIVIKNKAVAEKMHDSIDRDQLGTACWLSLDWEEPDETGANTVRRHIAFNTRHIISIEFLP
jgi:hypothetical protein